MDQLDRRDKRPCVVARGRKLSIADEDAGTSDPGIAIPLSIPADPEYR